MLCFARQTPARADVCMASNVSPPIALKPESASHNWQAYLRLFVLANYFMGQVQRVVRYARGFTSFEKSVALDSSLLSISCRTISRSEASGPSLRTASGACVMLFTLLQSRFPCGTLSMVALAHWWFKAKITTKEKPVSPVPAREW